MTQTLLVVAGEASGDLHGAEILAELKAANPDLRVVGIGGPRMTPFLDRKVADVSDLAVFGLFEVLRHLPRLRRLKDELIRVAQEEDCGTALLIDYQDFNRQLARGLRETRPAMHLAQYVCPQVWVWRKGRIPIIGKLFNTLYCLLPFEPPLFEGQAVKALYMGNPLVDHVEPEMDQASFLGTYGLREDLPIVALLPGSRHGEIHRLLPILRDLVQSWTSDPHRPEVQWVLPVAPTLDPAWLRRILGQAPVVLTSHPHASRAYASAALVCSGTATLETALLGTPAALFYRLSPLTYLVGRLLVKVKDVGLVNIVAGRRIVPEILQGDVTPERLTLELSRLLDPAVAAAQRVDISRVRERLGPGGAARRLAAHLASVMER